VSLMRNVRSSLWTVRVQSGPFVMWWHWCCDGAPCSVTLTIVRLQSSCDSSAKLSGNHDGVFTRLPVSLRAAHVRCDTCPSIRNVACDHTSPFCLKKCNQCIELTVYTVPLWVVGLRLISCRVTRHRVSQSQYNAICVPATHEPAQRHDDTTGMDREWLDEAYERVDGYG
jgi:hypothetical protein